MDRRRTLVQYRAVDLSLFALMLLVFESVIILASTRWFPGQPYTVSLVPALLAIVMMRWGPWAAIHAALGGLLGCWMLRASFPQYMIYCVGNLAALLILPWLQRRRKDGGRLRSGTQALGYGVAVLLLTQAGRAVMTLVFGSSLAVALGCFTTEAITDLFTLVILWIVQRLDGILEDQRHYLQRIQAEEKR